MGRGRGAAIRRSGEREWGRTVMVLVTGPSSISSCCSADGGCCGSLYVLFARRLSLAYGVANPSLLHVALRQPAVPLSAAGPVAVATAEPAGQAASERSLRVRAVRSHLAQTHLAQSH